MSLLCLAISWSNRFLRQVDCRKDRLNVLSAARHQDRASKVVSPQLTNGRMYEIDDPKRGMSSAWPSTILELMGSKTHECARFDKPEQIDQSRHAIKHDEFGFNRLRLR
jgi:hypothetical protein